MSTTITATAASVAFVFKAFSDHAVEHQLIAPHTVTVDDGEVVLRLDSLAGPRWLATVQVDEETIKVLRPGWELVVAKVRIPSPIGDAHVTLRFARVTNLRAVQ